MHKIVNAAVAVLKAANGKVLLAQRPHGKPWAGWWEFPGGKIEENESAVEGLRREVFEELGVEVITAYPWITRTFDYPDKTVKLHFFVIEEWQGEPHGKEGQLLSWQSPSQLSVFPMLPANTPVLKALELPSVYAITNLAEMGEEPFFIALEQQLRLGLRLVQIREKALPESELSVFAKKILNLTRQFGAKALLNGPIELALSLGVDGVHLPSDTLMQMTQKPDGLMMAASCHDALQLQHAQSLGADFVVLSPVQKTMSHPDAQPLGWAKFAEIAQSSSIPVFALGGMALSDMLTAREHGAHGIAMQRAIWHSER